MRSGEMRLHAHIERLIAARRRLWRWPSSALADLILLDDKAARQAAGALNLTYIGVVGILLAAKSRSLVPLVKPILDDLRAIAGFRLADATYQHALRLAGE